MGSVHAQITLINAVDLQLAEAHQLSKDKIRQITTTMLVDSGAYMMAINETTKAQLGLTTKSKRTAQLVNGSVVELDIVGPIDVRFENRDATCNAMVLPGDSEMLLGAIPMEEM